MGSRRDKAQIYTMEGITAALIILGVLYLIIEANSLVVPQTEKTVDMKLGQLSNDILTTLDWNSNDSWSTTGGSLQSYVDGWDGPILYSSSNPDPSLMPLDSNITAMLLQDPDYKQDDVQYSLAFVYNNKNQARNDVVLKKGEPGDNSMVATRIVTLNYNDPDLSTYWKTTGQFPQVVQVRLTAWHL